MRYGYSPELAGYLESVPRLARPILETVVTTAADIRDSKADFTGADSTSGFKLYEGGGIQLSGAGTTSKAANTTRAAGSDITSLTPPLSSPIDVGAVEWGGVWPEAIEIHTATAYLDPDTGAGQEVTWWYSAIYRLERIDPAGTQDAWTLRWLASDSILEADANNGSAGNVTFTFARGQSIPLAGEAPQIADDSASASWPTGPTTVMMVWALKGNGEVADNAAWECDNAASSTTSGSHELHRFQLTKLNNSNDLASLRYTATGPNAGVPAMAMSGNTGYAAATITFSTNDIDLGVAPTATTDLEVVWDGAAPGGSSFVVQIDDGAEGYTTVYSGDVIGQDNSADPATNPTDEYANNGANLEDFTRQQNYDIRATLTPSGDTSKTPRLFRLGVREVTKERVDGLVEFAEAGWAIDPITCQSEVPSMSIVLRRDGEKDYRSWSEELFSDNHLNDLLLRVWIGHPDLARRYWLHIDDFLVANYTPSTVGISVQCVSPLQYVLAKLPPKVSNARDPIEYDGSDLQTVSNDILIGQIGVSAQYLGADITDATTTVTKTIREKVPAIDVLREIHFINGSALISSQGRFKAQPLFDGAAPEDGAHFGLDDMDLLGINVGYDRRLPEFDVPYAPSGGEWTGEREHAVSATALANLGPTAAGQDGRLDDSTASWLEDSATADVIGARMVENFAPGLPQVRVRSHTPKPWLEPGDACSLEQDVFVGRDPRTGDSIRGRMISKAMVAQCHDVLGTEFTVWVRSWIDVITTATTTTVGKGLVLWDGVLASSSTWAATKVVRVDNADFTQVDGTQADFTHQIGYLSPNGTTARAFVAALIVPVGSTLTQIRSRVYATNSGDAIQVVLYEQNEDLTTSSSSLANTTQTGSTGHAWVTDSLSTEVGATDTYQIFVNITNATAQNDARFGFCEITYTSPNPTVTT